MQSDSNPATNLACHLLLLLSAALLVIGCAKEPEKKPPPPRPVHTAKAIQKDVPVYIDSFGVLSSLNDVDIKSQVTGKIMKVHFDEGQEVKKGDPLFTIDRSEYAAQLKKAKASLAENLDDLKQAKDDVDRNHDLLAADVVSKQKYEQYQTTLKDTQAEVDLDRAAVELAQINLDYCSIVSPVNGRTGKRQVDPGNIVTANSGPTLVNVKQMDPLYADFTVPDLALDKVRKAMAGKELKVEAVLQGTSNAPHAGRLHFLDNAVDDLTGTVLLRAVLPNKDRALWPGQFVDVRLTLGTRKNAVLVPYQSVQIGQKGPYLFAVTSDSKADLRLVVTGERDGDCIVVEKGVKPGETVVTVGQLGLRPGAPVMDVTAQAAAAKATGGGTHGNTKDGGKNP